MRFALPKNTASIASWSMASSASDSLAISYQSAGDGVLPDPNMILSIPNASRTGPTAGKGQKNSLSKEQYSFTHGTS